MTEQIFPLRDTIKSDSERVRQKKDRLAAFSKRTWYVVGILTVAVLTGGVVAQFLTIDMAVVAGLSIFCIGLWATGAVPEYWPAFAFFLVAIVFEIAPAEVVFSGFHSSTFWLLFSGIVVGAAIRHTGLGKRAAWLLSQMIGVRYASVISGLVVFSVLLAFVMPSSMGRIVLLIPIVAALADQMQYSPTSNGRIGMLSAVAFGTCLPAFTILPSNAPNMILAGMAETLFAYEVSYWEYLLLHFPVLGFVKAGLLVCLIVWMFPDRDPIHIKTLKKEVTPMSAMERNLSIVLGLSILLWLTDGIHHISPGWIGLAVALCCLWPYSNLTPENCLDKEMKYGALFFVVGIMGLGAVISSTGLGTVVVQHLSDQASFSSEQPFWNVIMLTGISTTVAIFASLPTVPAVMTPMSENLASLANLPLSTVLMTQVLAFSNVLLPYQAPPIIMAMQMGHLPLGAMSKLCIALFVCSAVILIPLDLLWWWFLGVL